MSKSNWDEQDIEKLLNEMPKQSDHRTKEQFFHQLQQKGIFDETNHTSENNHSYKAKKRIIHPSVKRGMTLVATFVLVLVIPMVLFIINNNTKEVATSDRELEMADANRAQLNKEDKEDEEDKEVEINIATFDEQRGMDLRNGLYEDEIVDETILYLGFAGDNAESIPAAFKISASWLKENKIDADQLTYLELYNKVIGHIDEELLGFVDYHPIVGRLEENGKTLIHYLPANHTYDKGTSSTFNYYGVMQDTFGHYYDELIILNEDGSPAAIDHIGILTEPFKISSPKQNAYSFYASSNGNNYLVTYARNTYNSIKEAITVLTEESNDLSPIISDASFTYNIENSELVITFDEPLDVTAYQEDKLMVMLESLIFTAASFDLQIRFENIQQSSWGGFNFTETIPRPVSVNEQNVAF